MLTFTAIVFVLLPNYFEVLLKVCNKCHTYYLHLLVDLKGVPGTNYRTIDVARHYTSVTTPTTRTPAGSGFQRSPFSTEGTPQHSYTS